MNDHIDRFTVFAPAVRLVVVEAWRDPQDGTFHHLDDRRGDYADGAWEVVPCPWSPDHDLWRLDAAIERTKANVKPRHEREASRPPPAASEH